MARRSRALQDEGPIPPPLYPRPKEHLLLNALEWYEKCKMQAVYMKYCSEKSYKEVNQSQSSLL